MSEHLKTLTFLSAHSSRAELTPEILAKNLITKLKNTLQKCNLLITYCKHFFCSVYGSESPMALRSLVFRTKLWSPMDPEESMHSYSFVCILCIYQFSSAKHVQIWCVLRNKGWNFIACQLNLPKAGEATGVEFFLRAKVNMKNHRFIMILEHWNRPAEISFITAFRQKDYFYKMLMVVCLTSYKKPSSI